MPREEIERRLWPDRNVDFNHSLDVVVSRLRTVLADKGSTCPWRIHKITLRWACGTTLDNVRASGMSRSLMEARIRHQLVLAGALPPRVPPVAVVIVLEIE
jgi:hypothetical protein